MSLQDLTVSLFGSYTPTGSYSVEFRNKNGSTIVEAFFARPPVRYQVRETQRSELQKTLYGGFIGDSGNDFKTITVEGQLWEYGVMNPSSPLGIINRQSPRNTTGLAEFFKLRYILMRYRDYTMTRNGKIIAPNFNHPALESARALKKYVTKQVENQFGSLADEVRTVWHCDDKGDHFYVKISEFNYEILSSDQFNIKYTLMMEAYEVDDQYSGQVKFGSVKKSPIKQLSETTEQMKFVATDSLPDELIAANTPSGRVFI